MVISTDEQTRLDMRRNCSSADGDASAFCDILVRAPAGSLLEYLIRPREEKTQAFIFNTPLSVVITSISIVETLKMLYIEALEVPVGT